MTYSSFVVWPESKRTDINCKINAATSKTRGFGGRVRIPFYVPGRIEHVGASVKRVSGGIRDSADSSGS